jgi:hypothetical protein
MPSQGFAEGDLVSDRGNAKKPVSARSRAREPAAPATAEERAEIARIADRLERLPKEIGWIFMGVGVLGVILPALPGLPFLAAGALALAPGGPKRLSRWYRRDPSKVGLAAGRVLDRYLDDLERRYPTDGRPYAK